VKPPPRTSSSPGMPVLALAMMPFCECGPSYEGAAVRELSNGRFFVKTANPAILWAMPKPNYSYEKRQRELDKKRKKAEKEADKVARKNAPADSSVQLDPSQPVPEPPKE
jgi:hypothetical protein